MKFTILLFAAIIFLFTGQITAQSLSHSVIGCGGGYLENNNVSLSFTAGEVITITFSASGYTLTQGFQQPVSQDDEDANKLTVSYDSGLQFFLYPNPAGEMIDLVFNSPVASTYDLQLFSITGQNLDTHYEQTRAGKEITFSVDLEDLPEGVYLLKIIENTGSAVYTAKVTKVE